MKIGFCVAECCEDFEQILGIMKNEKTPDLGVLNWTDGPRAVFADRKAAVAAINRTEHYRLAFGIGETGRDALPQKKFCKVIPLTAAP